MRSTLIYMDNMKLSAKNGKGLETLMQAVRIYSKDIGMEFSIEKCAINNEKEERTND